ncbi:MAG: metal-dependent hydrolase [Candidatus Aenigmatarchaeota archaeon]
MQKQTHLIFAFLLFILFGFVLNFPLELSIFAFIGALLPDLDLRPRAWHRKVCHNVWFLMIILFGGIYLFLLNKIAAIVLSIGFFSHLIADSLTHYGIMPFWPIKKPKFKGPITTGGLGEYLIVIILLVMIYWFSGVI